MPENDNFTPDQLLSRVAATLDQPDKFAKLFCEATKTQKTIDEALKIIIKQLIQHDNETRNFIKSILKELEKDELLIVIRKLGFLVWTLIVAAASAIITAIVK